MDDVEWIEFIKLIVSKGKNVNVKQECKERHVGLNTLYRKLQKLEKTNNALYQEFVSIHPYKPNDAQGVDFEQLMRESILSRISQKDLENKYGIPKRTIQRKFREIKEKNSNLYSIYQRYTLLKKGETLHHSILKEVEEEYIPQQIKTEEQKLEDRRKKFVESMKVAKESKNRQLCKHYEEQIERIEQQKRNVEQLKEQGIED